jgi:ribosome-associated protein
MRARLRRAAGRRMNAAGVVVINARRFRTQERNRADARERLIELLRRAARPAVPRLPTRPTAAARRRRLEEKQSTSVRKALRRPPSPD